MLHTETFGSASGQRAHKACVLRSFSFCYKLGCSMYDLVELVREG